MRFETRILLALLRVAAVIVIVATAGVWWLTRRLSDDARPAPAMLLLAALIALALALFFGQWLAARLCEPLSELRRRARSLAEGRWDTLLPVHEAGELGELARDLDTVRRAYVRLARSDEAKVGRLMTLSRLAGLLDVSAGERAVAQRALEIATRELPLRAGAVYLLQRDEKLFELNTQIGFPSKLPPSALSIAAHQHLLGRVRRAGQVIVTDAAGAEEWLAALGLDAESAPLVVAAPLSSGERLLGVMMLTGGSDELLPAEVEMLGSMGNQIGGALDTARAIDDSRRRMAHLEGLLTTSNEVARSLNEAQVLRVILTKARDLMQAEACAVFRLDESGQRLRIRDSLGLGEEFAQEATFNVGEGAVGNAMQERRVITVGDLSSSPDYAPLAPLLDAARYHAALAAPLIAGDRALGGLELYWRERRGFSAEEQRLLSIFANQAATAIVNAELHDSAQRRLEALSALFATVENLSATSTPRDLMEFVLTEITKRFPCNVAYVLMEQDGGPELVVANARGLHHAALPIPLPNCWAVKRGKLFEVRDDESDFNCAEVITNGPARSYACAPLTASGRTLGVLHMSAPQPRAFSAEQLQLFTTLANNLAIALERAHLFARIEQLAKTDSLTGLFNYREFRARLDEELRRAARFEQPLALLLIDLDHFKQHNDRFGHPGGDSVLLRFAAIGRAQIRQVDFFARYGGEEFAILLSNTDAPGAVQVAEKIRAAVEGERFPGDPREPVVRKTVSIGVAAFPHQAGDAETLIHRADQALYEAKQSGRNRVCVSGTVAAFPSAAQDTNP